MLSRLGARWRRLHCAPRDAGTTLAELAVGMTLLSIVGAIAINSFVTSTATANRITDQSLAGASARTAVDQLTTVLRLADTPTVQPGYATARFTLISATEVVFYSNLAPRSGSGVRTPPSRVDVKLAGGTLTESVWSPTSTTYGANYDYTKNYAGSPVTSVLLSGVTNTDVFTFCTRATDPGSTCTTTTDPTAVTLVQVKLTVTATSKAPALTVQSAVAITGAVT